jgi:hypothetical protein
MAASKRKRRPRLTVEQRLERDSRRRHEREAETLRRAGFTLRKCGICQREEVLPYRLDPAGLVCEACYEAVADSLD